MSEKFETRKRKKKDANFGPGPLVSGTFFSRS